MHSLFIFAGEEEAQGAIEYVLLAGGIITAALVIAVLYRKMVQSTAEGFNTSVQDVPRQVNAAVAQVNITS